MLTHMKIAAVVLQNAVRVLGLSLIALGIMFWSGRSLGLVVIHMRIGEVLVGLLWVLAAFAMRMGSLLPGGAHEIIRVLHLLVGLGAIGFAESLGARIKRGLAR
jgi:hypothetical protein